MKALGLCFCLFGVLWLLTIFCPAYWNSHFGFPAWIPAWVLGGTSLFIGVSLLTGKL